MLGKTKGKFKINNEEKCMKISITRCLNSNDKSIYDNIYKDKRLDFKSKAILTYMLSEPINLKLPLSELMNLGIDGESSIRSGINLLIETRYCQRYKVYDHKNRIICGKTIVYEMPYTDDEKIKRAKLSADGSQITYYLYNGNSKIDFVKSSNDI